MIQKTVLLATDGACDVQIALLAESLNKICKYLKFSVNNRPIGLGPLPISNPSTYRFLKKKTAPLLLKHSPIIIGTDARYDNNHFFDSDSHVVIISFSGWTSLTSVPKNNGFVGFLFSLLADEFNIPNGRHDNNTGCIYDFLWDKRGVDTRLRGGVICRECNSRLRKIVKQDPKRRLRLFTCTAEQGFEDLLAVLDEVSLASKRDIDLTDRWKTKAGTEEVFDVFLCHNSDDKKSVRILYEELVRKNIKPWFDEEHLIPGTAWQDELQRTIPRIRTAAVIVGPNGRGPWQDMELRAFLSEFGKRGCRVIPVILKDAPNIPELPLFLKQFTWVDFRRSKPAPLERLIWGIRGVR